MKMACQICFFFSLSHLLSSSDDGLRCSPRPLLPCWGARHRNRNPSEQAGVEISWEKITIQTYSLAEECVETNYYGTKRITEALIPLLLLSDSPRIVNVSSTAGMLQLTRKKYQSFIEEWPHD